MMYIFSLFVILCVCVFLCVRYRKYDIMYKLPFIMPIFQKDEKKSSEEAVLRPSVCLSLRWYKRVMCMLLFCAQFFEALIFAIYIDIRIIWYITRTTYMAYETTDNAHNCLE